MFAMLTPLLDFIMRRHVAHVADRKPKPEPELEHWQKPAYQKAVASLVNSGAWMLRAGFGVHPRQLRSERLAKRAVRGMSRREAASYGR